MPKKVPPKSTKTAKPKWSVKLQTIDPKQRVEEFPGEHFCVHLGELFCECCRHEVGSKLSIVKTHIDCGKHMQKKAALEAAGKRNEDSLLDKFRKFVVQKNVQGENVPPKSQIYKLQILEAPLFGGFPMAKVD